MLHVMVEAVKRTRQAASGDVAERFGDDRFLGEDQRDARTLAGFALDDEIAAVILDQRLDDTEAEPGAFVFAAEPAIDLVERLHDELGLLFAHADAAVAHREPQRAVRGHTTG